MTREMWLYASFAHSKVPCHNRLLCAGVDGAPAVRSAPREEVLDRYSGHTALCPDSMAAFKNAQKAHSVLSIAAGLGSAATVSYATAASVSGSLQADLLAK